MKTKYVPNFFLNTIISGAFLLCLMAISAAQANAQTLIGGNPNCASLGYASELKVDPPRSGTFNLPNGGQVSAIVNANEGVSFQATGTSILAVIVKGGPNANVYYYNSGATSGGPLFAPANGDKNYGLSHFDFCYDVSFAPTAATAMIAGRVTVNTGFVRGLGLPQVTILNTRTLESQTVLTNRLGYYEFNDLPVGDTYVISARGKGYSFTPQTFTLGEDSAMDLFGSAVTSSGTKGAKIK